MSSSHPDNEATPFLAVKDDGTYDSDTGGRVEYQRPSNSTLKWQIILAIACLLSTIANVTMLLLPESWPATPMSTGIPLRRPSQYIGLDDVYRQIPWNSTSLSFVTHPSILSPVSSKYRTSSLDKPHSFFGPMGMIYSEDKHFLVNSETSSVSQFRVLDFGMEECQIAISIPEFILPPAVADERGSYNLSAGGRRLTLSGEDVTLDVWRLNYDSPQYIDTSRLSWNTRPARATIEPFASLTVSQGNTSMSSRFRCPSDSLQTFEFACASDHCNVDFWQDKEEPLFAMYILQHSSL